MIRHLLHAVVKHISHQALLCTPVDRMLDYMLPFETGSTILLTQQTPMKIEDREAGKTHVISQHIDAEKWDFASDIWKCVWWRISYCESNFTELCSQGYNRQRGNEAGDYSVFHRQQAIVPGQMRITSLTYVCVNPTRCDKNAMWWGHRLFIWYRQV